MELITDFFNEVSIFSFFLTVSLIGVGIFAVAFILDGIFDAIFHVGDADVPIVQLLGVFLGGLGGVGLICQGFGITSEVLVLSISAVGGLFLSFVFYGFVKHIETASNKEYKLDTSKVVGSVVPVNWWSGTEGEVLLELGGSSFKVPAHSKEPLEKAARLRIVDAEFSGDRPVGITVEAL